MIKNVKRSGYYFHMNLNIWGDFQIFISIPLTIKCHCCPHIETSQRFAVEIN